MFQEKWIWAKNDTAQADSYVEFIGKFHADKDDKILVHIACDSIYNVEINGQLAAFGACADYPHHKYYDTVDITQYCKAENDIKIT